MFCGGTMVQGSTSSRLFSFMLLLMIPVCAEATLITFQFQVSATSGPLTGQMATGTFAIDSSIIPTGGGQVSSPSLFSALNFTWDGVQYTRTNTQTSSLTFDGMGNLVAWEFGTVCLPPASGGCLVRLYPPGFQDWFVRQSSNYANFFESGRPDRSFGFGISTVAQDRPLEIPTLSDWGKIILFILLFVCAARNRRFEGGRTGD